MELLVTNLTPNKTRRETVGGREYLVAPLSMIVHGVLNGSKGALYYPEDETRAAADAWNGMPITINHPTDPITNENLSAQHPGVLQRQGVGFVKNPVWNGKLRAEGWFDVQNTRRIAPDVLKSLEAGQPVELSTGLYTDNEQSAGTFNSVPYEAIARNHRPDHLAVLPTMRGACSNDDGCGIHVNAAKVCDKCKKELKDGKCSCPTTNAQTLWQKLGALLGLTTNATPNHPVTGRFTAPGSLPHAHAEKGFSKHDGDEPADEEVEDFEDGGDEEEDDDEKKTKDELYAATKQAALTGNAKDAKGHGSDARGEGGKNVGDVKGAKKVRSVAKKASDAADDATFAAYQARTKESHDVAATAHDKAADKHMEASNVFKKAGNDSMAKTHSDAAGSHQHSAAEHRKGKMSGVNAINNRGSNMLTREKKIKTLVSNCACWKDDEATLNDLSDKQIDGLYDQHVLSTTVHEHFPGVTANAMPAFIKKKIADKDDEDDSETEDDDEKPTDNVVKPLSERLTPEELQVWNHATAITNNHKTALVQRLTQHLADGPAKAKLVTNLPKKGIDELQDLLLLAAPVGNHQSNDQPPPHYLGYGGGPDGMVGNASLQEDTDLMPEATIDYVALSKENDTRNRQAS